MDEKVELFFGALRFSPLFMCVDLLFIAHFFFSWYRSWKKTGWKIDFWNFTLFFNFFVFFLCMYPFNASIFNIPATGDNFSRIDFFIDKAFGITAVGYVAVWMGRVAFDFMRSHFLLFPLFSLLAPMSRVLEKNIRNPRTVFWLFSGSLLFFIFILFIQLKEDCLFNPRQFFLGNDRLRPLFNLALTLFQIALLYTGIRCIQLKKKRDRYAFCTLVLFSLFLGIRGVVIFSLLIIIIYRIFAKEGRFSILKLFLQCFGLVLLGIYLDSLRYRELDPLVCIERMFLQVFYGSHFSDTRDFACILSYWDESYLYGKSYVAGLLSFLPRFLSEFRQDWAISAYTNSIVGLDGAEHGGMRPGLFGEAFLNFSYFGVVALGFLAGYALRYADVKIKEAVVFEKDIVKGYSKTLLYFLVCNLLITAGFWGAYVFLFLNLAIYLLNRVKFFSTESANSL